MPMSFKPYIRDTAPNSCRLPDAARGDFDDFDIPFTNDNASDVLAAIGLRPQPGMLPIDAFANLVTTALRRHLGKKSPAIPRSEERKPCQIIVINYGRAEGYIEAPLGDLAGLVQRSRAINATHIGWR
jgi:hypothetical protein